MAIGAVTQVGSKGAVAVELLAAAIAVNNPPAGGVAGLAIDVLRAAAGGKLPDTIRVGAVTNAGSGTMTVTLRLWGYLAAIGWVVAKALNAGAAIAETGTDSIAYVEDVAALKSFDRLYLEVVAIAGTSTSVVGYAVVPSEF